MNIPVEQNNPTNNIANKDKVIAYAMLMFATVFIFVIAEVIRFYLTVYELDSMFISFCAGFILFVPFVSLLIHGLASSSKLNRGLFAGIMSNIGLVIVVQGLFFLIWITDAVAVYSIYVDQTSFLAKAFNITSENQADLSREFYWANLVLAWFFSWLSLAIGVLPCLVARINHLGVVGNVVAGFSYAKKHKMALALYALCIMMSVVLPLLYFSYAFIVTFPITLVWVFKRISSDYAQNVERTK